MADLFARMWPADLRYYPTSVHAALMETIHIASLGTLLALVLALPIGILAAHNLCPFTPLNLFAKLILVSSRSVNSLVWALLFVGIFGPGALAGTLAIAFRSIGFVGKLFGEALEETHRGPIEALEAVGASWMSRLTFGYWPQVKPAFWSIALFRWDINVRESAVLGLVGAGRHRHDPRLRDEPVPVESRRDDPDRDLRGRDHSRKSSSPSCASASCKMRR